MPFLVKISLKTMGKLRKSGEKVEKNSGECTKNSEKTKELNEKEPKINRFPLFMMKNGL